jgi:uncharacterized membrane protein YgcG
MTSRGILIFAVMEQNRIEIEFGEGLSHILDQDWCHEVLISRVVPWFRSEDYIKGLEELVNEIDQVFKTSAAAKQKTRKKRKRGRWVRLAAAFGVPLWILNRNDVDEIPPPPAPGDRGKRRRRRKNGHSFLRRREFPPPMPEEPTNLGNQLAYMLAQTISRSSGRNYCSSGSKNPTVNVFYGSPAATQQSTTNVEYSQQTEMHQPIKMNEKEPPMSATKTAFVLKPLAFHPMERLRFRTTIPTSTDNTPAKSQKHSKLNASKSQGGGASWSSVENRLKPKEPKSKHNPRKGGGGGGASW